LAVAPQAIAAKAAVEVVRPTHPREAQVATADSPAGAAAEAEAGQTRRLAALAARVALVL